MAANTITTVTNAVDSSANIVIASLYPRQLASEQQEIRTLTLKPGAFNDPINCVLNTVSLTNHPQYTALSYVWGDPTDRLPIYIDGIFFSATKNLALALQHIRKVDQDEVLWIDAVCINQKDIDERNDQVLLMGTLYSEAEEVVIWLGEADVTTDELVDTVVRKGLPTPPATDTEGFVEAHVEYAIQCTRIIVLFEIISLRPWWGRVWTVQECVLPQRDPIFLCGLRTFLWEDFFDTFYDAYRRVQGGLNSVQGHDNHPSTQEIRKCRDRLSNGASEREMLQNVQAISLLGTVRRHFQATASIPLASCIAPCLERHASVPHDYIYGFLGLAATEERGKIEIDYRRSHWAVYRDFFELVMNIGGPDELKILTMISFHSESDERPSWLPDFSRQRDVAKYTGMYLAAEESFRTLEGVWWSDDNEILMLQGVCLDVVDQLYPLQQEKDEWSKHILGLANTIRHEQSIKLATSPLDTLPRELIETSNSAHVSQLFLGNIRLDGGVELSDAQIRSTWDEVAAYHYAGGALIDFDRDEFQIPREDLGGISLLTFIVRIVLQTYVVCRGRSIMISHAGLSGICVPNARPGDEIVCLYGFHMPFILRPMDGQYRIVGGVHIPGLMDWIALNDSLGNGRLREATFRLR
jgi:hypothetical protein